MKQLPVLNIREFGPATDSFYLNRLSDHLKKHHFIHHPHKHDFFLCVVFMKGKGIHEIDFRKYDVNPGTVFFLSPGQMHNWTLSPETEGYIFFHTKEFYDLNYQSRQVQDFPFYSSIYNVPTLNISAKDLKEVVALFELMLREFKSNMPLKENKLASLVDLAYIDFSRKYFKKEINYKNNRGYLDKLRNLERLIDIHFTEKKSPAYFAGRLNITGKHLNRITKETLNKTVSEMIADRIILEAKRLLVLNKFSVSQVADAIGFFDNSYFNRYFKKHTELTPLEFSLSYRKPVIK